MINYLANVLVNGPQTPIVTNIPPSDIKVEAPETPAGIEPPQGLRSVLLAGMCSSMLTFVNTVLSPIVTAPFVLTALI